MKVFLFQLTFSILLVIPWSDTATNPSIESNPGSEPENLSLAMQAPTALCQNLIVQLDDTGSASIVASDVDNGSSDLDGSIIDLSVNPSIFSCDDISTPVSVTLTATDNENETGQCTATVTVEDEVDPTAICNYLLSDQKQL